MNKGVAIGLFIIDLILTPIVFVLYYIVGTVYILCNCLRNSKGVNIGLLGFNEHFVKNIAYNVTNGFKEHKRRIFGAKDSKES